MPLYVELEEQGNFLFRYRGQAPVFLFAVALPCVLFSGKYPLSSSVPACLLIFSWAVSLCGFFLRCYVVGTTHPATSGRNRESQVAEVLNTTGIYSLVRHPLYAGNFLMWMGIAVSSLNLFLILIAVFFFIFVYERIIFAEEKFLERKFGEQFIGWTSVTPAVIPSFRNYKKTARSFSIKKVLANEYSSFLAMVTGFFYIDILKKFSMDTGITVSFNFLVIFSVAAAIALFLKLIKHHTGWLKY